MRRSCERLLSRLVPERGDLVLLALNLALLLLDLRLGLSLFVLAILHRIADKRPADQTEATSDRRARAGIACERPDNRASRGAADGPVGRSFFPRGERLSGASVDEEERARGKHRHARDSHAPSPSLHILAVEAHRFSFHWFVSAPG